MTFLLWWLGTLVWGFMPFVQDPFLIPKTMVWVGGAWVMVYRLSTTPSVVGYRFQNRWLLWLMGVVIAEFLVRFYLTMNMRAPLADEMPFNWFCVLPACYVLLGGLLVVLLATRFWGVAQHQARLTQALCYLGVSVAVYALLQRVGCDQFLYDSGMQSSEGVGKPIHQFLWMIAALGNVNYTVTFLCLVLPFYFAFQHPRYLVMLGVCLLAIWLSHKRFAQAEALAVLSVYGWIRLWQRRKRRQLLLGLTGIGALGIFFTLWAHPTWWMDERFILWKAVLHDWHYQALTGYGLGGFAMKFYMKWNTTKLALPPGMFSTPWMWAHNDALQWLYETGLLGTVPMLLLLGSVLRRAWKKTSSILGVVYFVAFLGLLLMSSVNFPWHFAPTALVGLLIWSVCETQGETV